MAGNALTDVFTLYTISGTDECWQWHGSWGGRERTLRPYYQASGQRYIAYRLVYQLVHGVTLTADQLIRHTCDHGGHPFGCGHPDHLMIGNNTQNMEDMKARERHGLPHHVVRRIRKLLSDGRPQSEIAELYGIAQTTVSAIHTGKTYDHITEEDNSDA